MNTLPVGLQQGKPASGLNYNTVSLLNHARISQLLEMACLIADMPVAVVSLCTRGHEWTHTRQEPEIADTHFMDELLDNCIRENSFLEITDLAADKHMQHKALYAAGRQLFYYAGYPLTNTESQPLGTLSVFDYKPNHLRENSKRALQLLALQLGQAIADFNRKEEIKHFSRLLDLSKDLICTISADGFLIKVNPAFERVLGWDKEHLMNGSLFNLVHADDIAGTLKEVARLTTGNGSIRFTHRIRVKNGSYKFLQWVAWPEPSSKTFFAIARDVTEEKDREIKLKISENKLKSFFENSQGLMCTHDRQGRFISVNNAGAGMLGYTVQEVAKMSLYDLMPARYHASLADYLDTITSTGKAKGTMVMQHKNGQHKIWMYNNVLVKNTGEADYIIGNAIDITERHYLEKDLQRTKEILEQTSRVAAIGGWEYNLVSQEVYWSDITKQIHEVEPDFKPDIETALHFYKTGENREKIVHAVEEALQKGAAWDLELQLITAKGNEIWVRAQGSSETEKGVSKRLYGTLLDITGKKRAEMDIMQSKKLLHDVLQSASEVSIIATDPAGLITVFNAGAERMLGYTADEMIGRHTPEKIHDAQEMEQCAAKLSAELGQPVNGFRVLVGRSEIKGSDKGHWTYIRKDGTTCTVSLVVTPIRDMNGTITGYLGIATDITKRKKAEQAFSIERSRLLAFVEHAPAAVAMLDKNLAYITVSNRWIEEYNLTGMELTGKSHAELFPDIFQRWKDVYARCLNGSVEKNEQYFYRPLGSDHHKYLRWEIRPWYQYDGTIGGIMLFTQDVSEIYFQKEELEKAKQHAEQASMVKSEFLANMSHEIRTPLNGVIGFTDLVLKTKLTETQKQYLLIVHQSGNALLNIISDILDFSKIEAGKLELDISKCDLYELASQTTDIISYQAQNKQLEVLLNIPANLPRFIWADSIRLKQVLINLLSNAIKFTDKGEIELKVNSISQAEPATFRFEVRDTGIGIPFDKQQKIFEAFLQEDASITRKYGGTGLGLTISNKLLGLMGSRLQVESTPGHGSRFYFELQLKSEYGEAPRWTGIGSVKKVLIVDDNDNNRTILKQMLLLKQIDSDEAKNGFEALNLLARGTRYDVLFVDYHMPYMDGLETIRKIRKNFPDPSYAHKIILLYSSSDDELMINASEELNITSRLAKPIKMQELYTHLFPGYQQDRSLQPGQPGTSERTIITQALTVLIAEDNNANRLLAKTIVKRIAPNARVVEAGNGEDAVKRFQSDKPDIILMDIQMPLMNGYEAARKIRALEQESHTPIIALTASNIKGEQETCMLAGMDGFLSKPFAEADLVQQFVKWTPAEQGNHHQPVAEEKPAVYFDMQQVIDYLDGDTVFLVEFLDVTRQELEGSIVELETAVRTTDLAALNAAAHKLKGTALIAGMDKLSNLAKILEKLSEYHEQVVNDLVNDVKQETRTIIEHIESAKRSK